MDSSRKCHDTPRRSTQVILSIKSRHDNYREEQRLKNTHGSGVIWLVSTRQSDPLRQFGGTAASDSDVMTIRIELG